MDNQHGEIPLPVGLEPDKQYHGVSGLGYARVVGGSQVRAGNEDQQFLRQQIPWATIPTLCCKTCVGRSAEEQAELEMCLMHSHSGGAGLFRYSSIPSLLVLVSLFHCSRHPCLPEQDIPTQPRGSGVIRSCIPRLHSAFSLRWDPCIGVGQGLLLPAGGPRAAPAAERKGGQPGAGSPAEPGRRCGGQSAALRLLARPRPTPEPLNIDGSGLGRGQRRLPASESVPSPLRRCQTPAGRD